MTFHISPDWEVASDFSLFFVWYTRFSHSATAWIILPCPQKGCCLCATALAYTKILKEVVTHEKVPMDSPLKITSFLRNTDRDFIGCLYFIFIALVSWVCLLTQFLTGLLKLLVIVLMVFRFSCSLEGSFCFFFIVQTGMARNLQHFVVSFWNWVLSWEPIQMSI